MASRSYRPGVGLTKTTFLNGQIGQLVKPTEAGRWVVWTKVGRQAIKPENLCPAADEVPEGARRFVAVGAAVTAHCLLELGRSGGSRPMTAAAVPILLMVWTVATLLGCMRLHRPIALPEAILPGLWELGIAPPAQGVFRGGSAMVAFLLACTVHLHQRLLQPELAMRQLLGESHMGNCAGYIASLGFALQGLFTPSRRGVSLDTLLHAAGALAFLLASAWHMWISLAIAVELSQSSLAKSVAFRAAMSSRQALALALPVTAIVACGTLPVLELAGYKAKSEDAGISSWPMASRIRSIVGLCQWALVLHFAMFYTTYALDFWIILTED
eukprot:TRINITY_DN91712_c0_g1_i2.p1 TRINITY_DN91712_c0_g1~~TRINITY_DN91712_c0_g1_i2.p1  ORF type:complete len:328 (-),score=53.36 TRINITY_DN91712_c0_g1_i2:13-996(-)